MTHDSITMEELVAAIVKAVPEIAQTCHFCDGEGKKECSNPDCNFIQAISCVGGRSASESQCPECGYKGVSKCDDCMGKGKILRPITLEDVLGAWNKSVGACLAASHDISIDHSGHFSVFDTDEEDTGMIAKWEFGRSLEWHRINKPETVVFLNSLLCV